MHCGIKVEGLVSGVMVLEKDAFYKTGTIQCYGYVFLLFILTTDESMSCPNVINKIKKQCFFFLWLFIAPVGQVSFGVSVFHFYNHFYSQIRR